MLGLYWGSIGIMEKKMETTTLFGGGHLLCKQTTKCIYNIRNTDEHKCEEGLFGRFNLFPLLLLYLAA